IRLVKTNADENDALDKLRSAGAELVPSEIAKGAWRVSGATAKLRELSERGELYIQDEASQLVAEVVNAQPGERVLDVCAAPGGKTTLIAELASDEAEVLAMDVSPRRLATIQGTIQLH